MKLQEKACPESSTSFLNQITFNYFNKMALLGHRRPLEMTDLWELEPHDGSDHLVPKFEHVWKKYVRKWRASHHETKGMPKPTGSTLPLNGASETEALQMTPVDSKGKAVGKGRKGKKSAESHEPPHPSVLWPLFLTFKWAVLGGALCKLSFDIMQFASPHLLKHLISFIEHPNQPMWVGVGLALAMFLIAMVQSMILHQYFHIMFRLGMHTCLFHWS